MSRYVKWGAVALGVILVVALFGAWVRASHANRTVVATVTDKDRVCDSAGKTVSCKYLVFTDHGTFENTDALFSKKFASSDLQGRITRGHTYAFTVEGFRVPIISSYPNILAARDVG